jgi:hypothetical protein
MKNIEEKETISPRPVGEAKAILVDPRRKAISKIEDQPHDSLYTQIYLHVDDDHEDYVSSVDASGVSSVIVASDCGFIMRFDGLKFVIPGCATIERIYCHDNLDRMDTPYEVTDFVISKTEVKGRFAIEWI